MKYFDLFGIPVQLRVDAKSLTPRFFELSKQFHPDFFVNQDSVAQQEALDQSSLLNKAWKTFQQPDETIRYVLMEKGLMQEEEKYELPPDFLMEVMDINEQLMDQEEEGVKARVEAAVKQLENEIYEPVKKVVEGYREGITSEEELLQVKAYYYKKKYLDRIRRQLAGMA